MRLIEVPELRLAANSITTICIGIFSSAYVNEITVASNVEWKNTLSSKCFLLLVLFSASWLTLQIFCLHHDRRVTLFGDDEYCLSFVRKAKLESYAEQLRRDPLGLGGTDINEMLKQLMIRRNRK